ncbi:MAG: TonB family protein [Muribaculaceae bacterium]|nr:TonB family protein [Muribaculaceae bacterium]
MARGKQTCKILKEIRRQIAEANGIEFVTSECRYKGDCLGSCPKCEAEVRYLEQQLRARSLTGKAVALAGISAGMILMSGCSGTSTKPQANNEILEEKISDTEVVKEIEEGEATILEDTVSVSHDLSTIKEEESASKRVIKEITIVGDIDDEPPMEEKGICLSVKEGDPASDEDSTKVRVHGEIRIGPSYPDEKGVYDRVDKSPEYPGGAEEMQRFIDQHIEYPEEQLREGIQGIVFVKFYVDTMGRVCHPEIIRSKNPAFNQEALRVVRLFPNFTPGMYDGNKVNTYKTVTINFKLPTDDYGTRKADLQDTERDTSSDS